MAKDQVRLDRDVAKVVKQSAKDNARSLVKEVNHLLRTLLVKKPT